MGHCPLIIRVHGIIKNGWIESVYDFPYRHFESTEIESVFLSLNLTIS